MICEKFMVIRMDDNGSSFLMAENLSETDADKLVDDYFGHKQYYMKVGYTSGTRAVVIAQYKVLQ